LTEIDDIYARRVRARDDYIGALATPLCAAPRQQKSLIRYIERRGFEALWTDPDLWFAPHARWLSEGQTWSNGLSRSS